MGFVSIKLWSFNAVISLLIVGSEAATNNYFSPYIPQIIHIERAPLKIVIEIPQSGQSEEDASTTTTTTERVIPVAIPVPLPTAVQVAVPAVEPPHFCWGKPCPACPPCLCAPSCTPSFFSYCSSCHQKCRCRRIEDNPEPLPLMSPQPLPGPVFAMPGPVAWPPYFRLPYEMFPWNNEDQDELRED